MSAAPTSLAPNTVVRATRTFELVTDWTIYEGQLAYIVSGPVSHGGVLAYQVQHWGDLTRGLRPDTVIGWVPAQEALTTFVPVAPLCPGRVGSILDVAGLQPFERLVCFGNRDLTLSPVRRDDPGWGGISAKPSWLAVSDVPWLGGPEGADFLTGLPVSVDPSTGIAIPRATWLTVTGHFDDAAAAECPRELVVWCRERFVITKLSRAEPPASELRGSWRRMAAAPIDGKYEFAATWTGNEVVFWGGEGANPGQGASYDPAADHWRVLPEAPIAGRVGPAAAWTGREVVVWGGNGNRALSDGAAYDPRLDRWRRLARSPLAASTTARGFWTGTEFVVITGTPEAAAWNPGSNTWRALPAPPFRAGHIEAVWDGREILAIALGDGGAAPLEAAALDPAAGAWRSIAPPPFDGGVLGVPAVWIGTGMLFVDRLYDPAADEWQAVGRVDCRNGLPSEGQWTGELVISQVQAYDPAAGRCRSLPRSPQREWNYFETTTHEFAPQVWTGRELVVWSGGTGADGSETPNDGIVFVPDR